MKLLDIFFCVALLVISTTAEDLHAQEIDRNPQKITCGDGFQLDAVVDIVAGTENETVERVIILVPGSGAHSMDVDLTVVTRDNAKNLLFKTIGHSVASSGFAVIRYNKRNYQMRQILKSGPESDATRRYKESLIANPLKHFVDDVLSIASMAKEQFPNADIYLLGHSEGTYVSLQAAHQTDLIKGVGLIGFAEYSTDTLVFVQTVYRPLNDFYKLDKNSDNKLNEDELGSELALAKALKAAMPILDFNKDGQISRAEFQATSLANLLVRDVFAPFRKQEAEYPRVAEILKAAKFKVAFFQGMLDNQTPAYHAMAFELLLKQLGKAGNMRFHFFDGLGHALDSRSNYQDNAFSPIDSDALAKMTETLDTFFRTSN